MITAVRALLVVSAAVLTTFAFASLVTGYDATFKTSALAAVLCLGGSIGLEQLRQRIERRNEALRRQWMAEYREMWFGSFERRRRMRGAR